MSVRPIASARSLFAPRPTTAASIGPPARSRRPSHHLGAVAAVLVLAAGLVSGAGGEPDPDAAQAAVTPTSGFQATVAGWTSWYGAYGLADLGWAWCIDHGSSAPDPELVYAPTQIAHESGPDARAAMAWAVTMNPPHDAVTAAAIMLVLHDLRGASYPFGPLVVDQLGPADLAGFGGAESAVVDRARAVLGDARAHAHLREPFSLAVAADRAGPNTDGAVRMTLVDAGGAPVVGVPVTLDATGATITSGTTGFTGPDGTAWFGVRVGEGENRFVGHAALPRTEPAVFAPTRAPAQRVIVPSWTTAEGADAFAPPPPTTTTTTTTVPPTTTTVPPTTTTTRPPTTTTTIPPPTTTTTTPPRTTAPPTSTTTTTAPPSTTTSSTTAPVPSTSTTGAPVTTPMPPSPSAPAAPGGSRVTTSATLPRTGRAVTSLVLIGTGAVLLGAALVRGARYRAGRG